MRRSPEADNILYRKLRIGCRLLFDQCDTLGNLATRHCTDIAFAQSDDAAPDLPQPADKTQKARLARAIGSEQTKRLARRNIKADAIDDHCAAGAPGDVAHRYAHTGLLAL
jgi:hypothetical protein